MRVPSSPQGSRPSSVPVNALSKRVTEWIFQFMKIDDEWSVRSPGEFTWWAHFLAQHVWCEQLPDGPDGEACRVHVSTDLLDGFDGAPPHLDTLFALQPLLAPLTAIVKDGERIRLEAAVYVNETTEERRQLLVAWIAAITVAVAHKYAPLAARLTDARIHRTPHPDGEREEVDGLVDILRQPVGKFSRFESPWKGEGINDVRSTLEPIAFMLPGQGGDGLSAEFPYEEGTSLLRVLTDVADPHLGNGVLLALSLPVGSDAPDSAHAALELNARSIADASAPDTVGGWIPHAIGLTHVTFVPNAMLNGADVDRIAAQQRDRTDWASRQGINPPPADLPALDPVGTLRQLAVPGYIHFEHETTHKPWWRVLDQRGALSEPVALADGDFEGTPVEPLVLWGIFNPGGPTVSALVLLPLESGAGIIVHVMRNPFGQRTDAIALIDDRGPVAVIRATGDLFRRNFFGKDGQTCLIAPGGAPTFVSPRFPDPAFAVAFPDLLAASPALAVCDLDENAEQLTRHDGKPWQRATEELHEAVKAHRRHYLRVAKGEGPEGAFARWYHHVSDPVHVEREMSAILEAWSASVAFIGSFGGICTGLANDAYDVDRLIALLQTLGIGPNGGAR